MEEPQRSERRSARWKRNPLSDLTNAPILSSPDDPLARKPKPKPNTTPSEPRSISSIESSRLERLGDSGAPVSTPRGKELSTGSVTDVVDCEKTNQTAVSRRSTKERRRDKGKAVAAPTTMSCPPLERTKRIGITRMEGGGIVLPGAHSEPYKKAKKRKHLTTSEDGYNDIRKRMFPQDFVEKQRAYFAEIDAFELPEEVVSESDLE